MKKTFSALLALVICLSMTLTSFAAVSLRSNYFNEGTAYYFIGDFDSNADEVGIKVGENTYALDSRKMFQANSNGKYIIGLNDPDNTFGLEFDAIPYVISDGVETTGDALSISKNVLASLTSVTVGGKTVSGFYPGTKETEFYYGLEELPSVATELPAVNVYAGETALSVNVEEEVKGYAATAYYNNEKVITVHFREFSEVTRTVALSDMYRVSKNTFEFVSGSPSIPASSNNTVKSNIYTYAHYEIPEVEGYAPVAYDLDAYAVLASGSTITEMVVDAYNYFGDLTGFETPVHEEGSKVAKPTPPEIPGFKGVTNKDADLIGSFTVGTSTKKFPLSSLTVNAENVIIVYKTENTSGNSSFMKYNESSYPNNMILKYVEKNPVDDTLTVTDLKSISVNGEEISEFTATDKAYYVGVEDISVAPEVTAVPEINDATVEVVAVDGESTVRIDVTAKDGKTTDSYYIYYREVHTKTVPYSDAKLAKEKSVPASISTTGSFAGFRLTNSDFGYVGYVAEGIESDAVITSVKMINSKTSYLPEGVNAETPGTVFIHKNENDYNTIWKDGIFTDELRRGTPGTIIGEVEISASGTCNDISIDLENISVYGNTYIFAVKADPIKIYFVPGDLEISYIYEEDPLLTSVEVESIEINDEIITVSEDVNEYYIGVEDVSSIPDVVVNTVVPGVEYSVSADEEKQEIRIDVTSKDGSKTKTLYVYYRLIQTMSIPFADARMVTGSSSSSYTNQNGYLRMPGGTDGYIGYNLTDLPADAKISAATLLETTTKYYSGTLTFYQSAKDVNAIWVNDMFDEGLKGKESAEESRILAVKDIESSGGNKAITAEPIELDASKLVILDGNVVIIYAVCSNNTGAMFYAPPALEISYFTESL